MFIVYVYIYIYYVITSSAYITHPPIQLHLGSRAAPPRAAPRLRRLAHGAGGRPPGRGAATQAIRAAPAAGSGQGTTGTESTTKADVLPILPQ